MSKPHGIIVFGANGSGKTTLARELARVLGFKHMDIEDYCFEASEVPYAVQRSREDCLRLMRADMEKHGAFVLSAVTGDFGQDIAPFYELGVYLSAPPALRLERVKQRAFALHGARVLEGGDMYEQELKFFEFVASRPLSKIDRWAETLACPVVRVDGETDWRENAEVIARRFYDERGRFKL